MDNLRRDLTESQAGPTGLSEYAVFLPATSGFYATFVGKQRYSNYVAPTRVPASFTNGVESLNYLDPVKGQFYYKWCLYSAGHANLDLNEFDADEDMFRNRDRSGTSLVLGDSGGFQIGKLKWPGEWRDPTSPVVLAKLAAAKAKGVTKEPLLDANGNVTYTKRGVMRTYSVDHAKEYQKQLDFAQKKREQVLTWMDALMDYGMVLDIPAWVSRDPRGAEVTGIHSYQDAVQATKYNNLYFINNRTGNCKFLNVLQGETHAQAEDWYQQMKEFCDTSIYGNKAFNGWAMGGQNMCSVTLVLKRIVALMYDKLLEKGQHDWMHFLGTSKLEWAVLLTEIQRAVRKHHNENFTISFDCASPFLATANGQIYTQTELEDRKKWVYRMVPSADDKKYATDTRLFKDAVIQDNIFKRFDPSPIIDQVKINDICIYPPGVANKVGKIGSTSWDSFSYAIQMGHNVWAHINSVQLANQAYDAGIYPAMLINESFQRLTFTDVVEEIFATSTREDALKVIDKYDRFLTSILGTRGLTGKRETNAATFFDILFEEVTDNATTAHAEEFDETEEIKLDQLEDEIKHGT